MGSLPTTHGHLGHHPGLCVFILGAHAMVAKMLSGDFASLFGTEVA